MEIWIILLLTFNLSSIFGSIKKLPDYSKNVWIIFLRISEFSHGGKILYEIKFQNSRHLIFLTLTTNSKPWNWCWEHFRGKVSIYVHFPWNFRHSTNNFLSELRQKTNTFYQSIYYWSSTNFLLIFLPCSQIFECALTELFCDCSIQKIPERQTSKTWLEIMLIR